MRAAQPKASRESATRGDARAAMARATRRIEAVYEYPFHSHATMGPGCAVADVQIEGITTVWCGAQKPHQAQRGYAELLGVAPEKVRVAWMEDSGSYGSTGLRRRRRRCAGLVAGRRQARARPVDARRPHWLGPEGPSGGLRVECRTRRRGQHQRRASSPRRAFSGGEINFIPTAKGNFLAAQLMGLPNTSGFR